jgi:hypothetical protein
MYYSVVRGARQVCPSAIKAAHLVVHRKGDGDAAAREDSAGVAGSGDDDVGGTDDRDYGG